MPVVAHFGEGLFARYDRFVGGSIMFGSNWRTRNARLQAWHVHPLLLIITPTADVPFGESRERVGKLYWVFLL